MKLRNNLSAASDREKEFEEFVSVSEPLYINVEAIEQEPIIKDLHGIHEYLAKADEYTAEQLIIKVKEHNFYIESRLISLVHLIYRISACNPANSKKYVDLINLFSDKLPIKKCIIDHLEYGIEIGSDYLISELFNANFIGGLNKFKYWKSREINNNINSLAERIIYDDVDEMQQIITDSLLDMNTRIEEKILNSRLLKDSKPTMIQYAAFNNSLKCFKYLFLNGADLYELSNDFSLFSFAVGGGNIEIIQLLNEEGFEPEVQDILVAIEQHRTEIFDWILEQLPDCLNDDILYFCVQNEFIHGILLFSKFQATKVFDIACQSAFIDLVRILQTYYSLDPSTNIVKAAERGSIGTVKLLLTLRGTDVNKSTISSPLVAACDKDDVEMVKYLLSRKDIDVNKRACRRSPLLAACQNGKLRIVKILLRAGGININDSEGEEIPIFAACERGHEEIVEKLLKRCDLHLNRCQYDQLIIIASKYFTKKTVMKLIEKSEESEE